MGIRAARVYIAIGYLRGIEKRVETRNHDFITVGTFAAFERSTAGQVITY